MSDEASQNNLSKKGRIAKRKLDEIGSNINSLLGLLKKVKKRLEDIIEADNGSGLITVEEKLKEVIEKGKDPKQKIRFSDKLGRIEFYRSNLNFYIEFTIVSHDNDDLVEHEGRIVYGVNRTLCYKNCIMYDSHYKCERLGRCDGLEDKPFAQFSIDRHGRIQSNNNIEGEWLFSVNNKGVEDDKTKNKKDLSEIHYLTLVHIWKDALSWVNEKILP